MFSCYWEAKGSSTFCQPDCLFCLQWLLAPLLTGDYGFLYIFSYIQEQWLEAFFMYRSALQPYGNEVEMTSFSILSLSFLIIFILSKV